MRQARPLLTARRTRMTFRSHALATVQADASTPSPEQSVARAMVGDAVTTGPPSCSTNFNSIPQGERPSTMRPMRTKARAVLIDALRDGQRWLDELTTKSDQTIEVLAAREGRTERSIRMTLSLAFLCPALARAAIDCLAGLESSA